MKSWLRYIRVMVLVVIPLALVGGWMVDRSYQWQSLEPMQEELAKERENLRWGQSRLQQHRSFDGFDSSEEVMDVIANNNLDRFYLYQASAYSYAPDDVFNEATPQLIALLGNDDPRNRQRAWQMLQDVQGNDAFEPFKAAYVEGIAQMLRLPSVAAFKSVLPWLRKERIQTDSIREALTIRMNDDNDRYAPMAAYTLAELYPEVDIAPRLIEMVEREHSQWRYILYELPHYMPEEEVKRLQEKYRR